MKSLDRFQVLEAAAKGLAKWCLYLSVQGKAEEAEVLKAAPCLLKLDPVDRMNFLLEGRGFLTFDSEEECYEAYGSTVGEDGPTKTNPYAGPVVVFATTYNPQGQGMSENC